MSQPGPDRESARPDAQRLGPYRLVHVLGEGGMGVVHLAVDPRGRAVAVKVLRDHIAHDADSRVRLAREVSVLSRVQHPRVAPVLDADTVGPRPYVVTRYVPGEGLDDVVRSDGPFRGADLVRLGRGLAEALDAIHDAGIVHRDLKPGNVLLVDGDPVVIDFGIAHVADDTRLTSTGLVMGTPGYLSPEVVSGQGVTVATDWWGWAATMAYAATGRPPFGRGPLHVVLDRVRDGQADLDGLPAPLRTLLADALSPDPMRRPTRTALLAGLDAYEQTGDATTLLEQTTPRTAVLPVVPAAAVDSAEPVVEPTPAMPQPARPAPHVGFTPPPVAAPAQAAPPWQQPVQQPPVQQPPVHQPPVQQPPVQQVQRPGEQLGDPRLGQPGRSGALTALAVALAALAATLPVVAAVVAVAWAVVARTCDRVVTGLVLRRHAYGARRGSDLAVATLATPLHLLTAVLTTVLSAVPALLVGASVAFLVTFAGSVLVGLELSVWGGPALGLGALAAVWTSWWGPGGTALRRGSRSLVRTVTPPGLGTDLVASALAVTALLLLGWSFMTHGVPSWTPLTGAPDGSPTVPWQW